MAGYYRAVAIDYDGTLTRGPRPGDDVLDALAAVRADGVKVLLVTGRILSELEAEFPDVAHHFDAVVAENGGVFVRHGHERLLAPAVEAKLVDALRARGVPVRAGRVLLATEAVQDVAVLAETRRLGLDYQLVHNRGALMVLPPGVSKGSGVYEALGELGVSYHSAIGVGDAENDHALLAHCELGVAVANAVESLRARADLVLPEPDGAGVVALLRGPVLAGRETLCSERWQVELGKSPDGRPVRLPASQRNLLIVGGSRSGKSYIAGLMAEQLVDRGYSVLVADPEGDHLGLASLRGALPLGGDEPLPSPGELAALLGHRFSSAVLDLSGLSEAQRDEYLAATVAPLADLRAATGLPHWLVVDEAHRALGRQGPLRAMLASGQRGCCIVTYRPADLCATALAATDAVVLVPGHEDSDVEALVGVAAAVGGLEAHRLAGLLAGAEPGQAVLVERAHPGRAALFEVADRATPHVRHWHKYARTRLAPPFRFYFRQDRDRANGAVAANLVEFHHLIARCDPAVIRHHATGRDFSRWIEHVIRDLELARRMALVEDVISGEPWQERMRLDLLACVEERYLG